MKQKYTLLIILIVVVAIALYLYKRLKSPGQRISFMAELEDKQKKLDLICAQLSDATFKKECIERIVARKTSLIICGFLLLSLSTSVLFNLYGSGILSGFYIALAWYLLAFFTVLYYNKIPSWAAATEIVASRIRVVEYRKHNFDPDTVPMLAKKAMILKQEIKELKDQQTTISGQSACGYS